MESSHVTRREFMVKAGQTALAAAVVAPIIGFKADASSGKTLLPLQPLALDLTKPEYAALATVGNAIKVDYPGEKNCHIIVNRVSESSVSAYLSKCAHMGCELPLPKNNLIVCPCHGAQYDGSGKVLKGPAKTNLRIYSADLQGNTITIKEMPS